MPMILPPKELLGKIKFSSGKAVVKDNVILSEKEKRLFDEYRNNIEYSDKHRLD